jgi:pyruvate,water dikinase
MTCHAAIVSRELGIPCVVGTATGTGVLANGQEVTIYCAEGDDGKVYAGTVPFERQEIDPATLPETAVPLMLNLANPERAFYLAQLPTTGVGLVRIEFVVSNWIGIHPMALLHPERLKDRAVLAQLRERVAGYRPAAEFFTSRLAMGVAQIAAAFYPRPVIVRFSDFKTNEYAGLLGGSDFEPVESNPMIGFRGASRYYDERYRAAFALECAAIRRVREEMGFTNVKVMIPFCRTLDEGRRVLRELAINGLIQGQHGLEVYVMCEIPNNVILAEEFSELFDGFSIGSNDLTQLALGIDRDSELLARLFDERDLGVKRLIQMVVVAAHKKGRRVGICGQAPSDYPEFAEYLASIGIDSISLNPDSLAKVAMRLAAGPEEC